MAVKLQELSENPCRRNCCLDDSKVCLGCGRTLPEILEWHQADNIRQSEIISRAKHRLVIPVYQ